MTGDDVADVAAELAVRRTLARYCHLCDDGDLEALAALFTGDGMFLVGDDVAVGREAIVQWFDRHQRLIRRGKHLNTNVVADIVDGRATVVSDFAFLASTTSGLRAIVTGRYRDALRLVDGAWLIERRECVLMASLDRRGQ